MKDPALQILIDRVLSAQAAGAQLDIRGGGTKAFYGEVPVGEPLDTRVLEGISSYEPTELVVTARCGTSLAKLEATLAEQGQCLPFEPPHFAPGATVGGMVAAGLAGPARAAVGSVRDYVLGATLLNGRAEVLSFGGQVMKNVAGYDVARLLAGSLGTLGVILEVSLKVLPVAPATATLRFSMDQAQALDRLNRWGGQPLPINASAWWDGTLLVRLRGAFAAVQSAIATLGGELIEPAHAAPFWDGLRDHGDEFFAKAAAAVEAGAALWRLSVPQTAPVLALPGEQLVEWGGAQRWLCSGVGAAAVRDAAARAGGHATLFRARDKSAGAFAPLKAPLDRIHRELKKAFDPSGVFNAGRLYPGL
ncbi:MAG: glycolate oxidase subunit GlcE [Piscinibacter sp.]|uniref:glycolate oxidase subunit GlcE n=1 Tax=Piscinibacter TaxID=1114981 RepID=UPI000FDF4414|nr:MULTISPECIES: glycolate oxidase subunit GlcE [Piscinibacter]MCW5667887.1 glycolate oxidase subunit GlcE [Piscinibacter sp.]